MIAYTTIDLLRSGRRVPASLTQADQLAHSGAYGKTSLTWLGKIASTANLPKQQEKRDGKKKVYGNLYCLEKMETLKNGKFDSFAKPQNIKEIKEK